MAVGFAGISLAVIAAIALLVRFEKLAPFGAGIGRLAGVALVAIGVWLLIS